MDTASAIMIVKAGTKVAGRIARYIDADLHTWYGLAKPAWASFRGDGAGVLGDVAEGQILVAGVLSITFESRDRVRLDSVAFEAASKLWNGPNGIPDNLDDGSLEMSLWHDLIWEYAKVLARLAGCSEQDVMHWGDGILNAAYRGYGSRHGKKVGWRARIAYNVCEWSRHWWHRLFPAACMLVAGAMLAGCSGCATPPPWELEDCSEIEIVLPEPGAGDPGHMAATNAPATEAECQTP